MRTSVRKWGNSLALRLPKTLAQELNVKEGDEVNVTTENGRIVLTPLAPWYSLDALLKGITAKNRHPETDTGAPTGKEIW